MMEEGLINPTTSHFMDPDRDVAAHAGGDEEEEFYDCKSLGIISFPATFRMIAYIVSVVCINQSFRSKRNF